MTGQMPLQCALARQAHEGPLDDLLEACATARRERIALRHDQHETVLAKGVRTHALGHGTIGRNADVGRARRDRLGNARTFPLLEIDADRRIGLEERRERPRQMLAEGRRVRKHVHTTAEAPREGAEIAAHGLDLLRDDARMIEQALPGRRQRHAATPALEKIDAESLLHAANARTRRGKRQMRAFGAVCDAGRIGHMEEQAQIDEVKAHG